MLRRVTGHEIRARGTDLGTIEEQADVRRIRVLPSLLEAVSDIVETGLVARRARVDAGLHRVVTCVSGAVLHVFLVAQGGEAEPPSTARRGDAEQEGCHVSLREIKSVIAVRGCLGT